MNNVYLFLFFSLLFIEMFMLKNDFTVVDENTVEKPIETVKRNKSDGLLYSLDSALSSDNETINEIKELENDIKLWKLKKELFEIMDEYYVNEAESIKKIDSVYSKVDSNIFTNTNFYNNIKYKYIYSNYASKKINIINLLTGFVIGSVVFSKFPIF